MKLLEWWQERYHKSSYARVGEVDGGVQKPGCTESGKGYFHSYVHFTPGAQWIGIDKILQYDIADSRSQQ
jgi:hypothetical protein